jgi:hypothetical protein
MHYAKQNFGEVRDDKKVFDQIQEWNKSNYNNLNINIEDTIVEDLTIPEAHEIKTNSIHVPHIKNMYTQRTVSKLVAYHILSSRDQIQGGEFQFQGWGDPTRRDNFGKVIETNNPYPVWLNEQGTLFCFPAAEGFGTRMIISGELKLVKYVFRGENYR